MPAHREGQARSMSEDLGQGIVGKEKGKSRGKSRGKYPQLRPASLARNIFVKEDTEEPFTLFKARRLRDELDNLKSKYAALYTEYGANNPQFFEYFGQDNWEELKDIRDEIDRVQRILGKRKKRFPAFRRCQDENRAHFVELTEKAADLIEEFNGLKNSLEELAGIRENDDEPGEDVDEADDD